MTTHHSHDAIIVGGGMVGLALAVAAARENLSVLVIEQHYPEIEAPNPGKFAPRVSAISHHSQQWLARQGAWQRLPKGRVCSYGHMSVWDGLGSGHIDFDAAEVQAESLGHIVENHWVTQALWETAEEHPTLQLVAGHKVAHWEESESGVEVTLDDGQAFSAPVLAACDGKFSKIREEAGFDTREWAYGHTALVTSIRHSHSHAFTARQVFLDSGPLAFLPLTDETGTSEWSSIVWSAETERAEALFRLDEAEFLTELNRFSEGCLGEITATDPRFRFPLTQMHAKRYWRGRVVLLGDAAHAIHPLAGQGVNLGFLDAEALSREWVEAKNQGRSTGDAWTLRRFQRKRQAHNLAAMATMEGFKRLFGTDHPAPVLLRNHGLALFDRFTLAKRPLIHAAMGEFTGG